jgi:glycerol-3-phosphate dehydrogenase (NAD(P)+)
VASSATAIVAGQIARFAKDGVVILNAAKALDKATARRLSVVFSEALAATSTGRPPISFHYAAIAGGTVAAELFNNQPLGVTIASEETDVAEALCKLFESPTLKTFASSDLAGTEFAAAFKNVVAVFAGVISGLGHSYGSETLFISLCADQIAELVCERFGGQWKTFSLGSQCWGNDLVMSATSPHTRNRRFGRWLGEGMSVSDAMAKARAEHMTVEGLETIAALKTLLQDELRKFAVLDAVHAIVQREEPAKDVIARLMLPDGC